MASLMKAYAIPTRYRIGSNTVKMVVTAVFHPVVLAPTSCSMPIGVSMATRKKPMAESTMFLAFSSMCFSLKINNVL